MTLKLNSLSQNGGVIINNVLSPYNPLLKTNIKGDNLIYSSINTASNTFGEEHLKSIKVFINFILPYITYKGKKLGLESIKNIETLYGGSFGMTIVYDEIVIKISRSYKNNDRGHVAEIKSLENLFKNNAPGAPPPPNTLSKYHGFMCNKGSTQLNAFSTYKGAMNILTNLFTNPLFAIDEKEIFLNAHTLGGETFLTTDFLNTMVVIFLEKDSMNLSKFNTDIMQGLTSIEKMEMVCDFLKNMTSALNYLHRKKFLIHCDIKPDNIVVSPLSTGGYIFKLIDFGSLTQINKKTGESLVNLDRIPRTRVFYEETFHEARLTFAYDEYCVLFSALMMLGIGYNSILVNELAEIAHTMKTNGNTNPQIANEIITTINRNNPAANLLKYEHPTLTKEARDGYKLLVAFILTSPCKGGLYKFTK